MVMKKIHLIGIIAVVALVVGLISYFLAMTQCPTCADETLLKHTFTETWRISHNYHWYKAGIAGVLLH